MPRLQLTALKDRTAFENAGIRLPNYDVQEMAERTKNAPLWVHFGAGNIFRSFLAALAQRALDDGRTDRGLTAAESFDFDIVRKIYEPHDNLSVLVKMRADGTLEKELIASVAECLTASVSAPADWERLARIFRGKSLQVASFTITEKGYAIRGIDGEFSPVVKSDIENGPASPRHAMSVAAAMGLERFKAGGHPIAFLSLDNCSQNGARLCEAVVTIAKEWTRRGFADAGFTDWLQDGARVSFPWSMIDKITPHPAESVKRELEAAGLTDMDVVVTSAGTVTAPFVNAEAKEYLVVEDDFPAGRMNLSAPGVYFADRATVERAEKMKVGTCLNPIHTAFAIFGCLLGYKSIWEETRDPDLSRLVHRLTFTEGMPVVTRPGIMDPEEFARDVLDERLPNPNIPDTPQRIATDTSQKLGVRFGETLKAYRDADGLDPASLICVPLVIAAWFRYLLALDDNGAAMQPSPDPMLADLQGALAGVEFGRPESYNGQLASIMGNESIFHVSLATIGLASRVEEMFVKMIKGPGSVRQTLREYLG